MQADIRKIRKWAAILALLAVFCIFGIPYAVEKTELARRKRVCEEYLAQADISLGFSVEFDIVWEPEVYGRDDYEIRNIYPENADEQDLTSLCALLDTLEYCPEENTDTEQRNGCNQGAMRFEVKCKNGGYIRLLWDYGGDLCVFRAYDGSDKSLASAIYWADPEAVDNVRAQGGLPPIPTLEQIIGRE